MLKRLIAFGFVLTLAGGAALAQTAPERRTIYEDGVDFYGGDLRSIFDTQLEACEQACLSDLECKAFTYNRAASACFLKTGVDERQDYAAALSATIEEIDPAETAALQARADELDFLGPYYLERARHWDLVLGREFGTEGLETPELIALHEEYRSRGDMERALHYRAAAQAVQPTANGWVDVAWLAGQATSNNGQIQRRNRELAVAAALNGALRAENANVQALALNELAVALERNGEGRLTIPTLRLSLAVVPRPQTQEALDRVIGLYGFRIVEHNVDSDSASPRICLVFNEPLIADGVEYGPYVAIQDADLPVEVEDAQLCIDGVEHGQRYRFTVREGLPAASGEALHKSVQLSEYIRDRAPTVYFPGRAYVLPRTEGAAIPVVTVNTKSVDLRIHRVGDRNLMGLLRDDYFGQALQEWDEKYIQNALGEQIWEGSAEVADTVNADVTTALPIGEAVSEFEPGVYAMVASVGGREDTVATQWFIVSDLGLTSMRGNDGLHVFVRSLGSAGAKPGVTAVLVSAANEVLGEAITDAEGYARFAPGLVRGEGSAAPALLTVSDEAGDYAFLDLTEAAFDLSDRGVAGHPSPPHIDVFATTERGAYRPGETVHATVLARSPQAEAIANLPLTVILMRPDGVEFAREVLTDQGAGGRSISVDLPRSAQRGTWRMRVHGDVEAAPLADISFLVEDFTPERIDFFLSMAAGPVRLIDSPALQINAHYLYGAPGAELDIEGEVRVGLADGYAEYPGYSFGLSDEQVNPRIESIDYAITDAEGRADLQLRLPEMENASRPLEMTAFVRLKDGSGRPVERTISRPVLPLGPMIGIKPLFDGVLGEGGTARFELIAIGEDRLRTDLADVNWTLERIETRYQWYRVNGRWNWEPITTRERVAEGTSALFRSEEITIEAPVRWGEYELRVASNSRGYAASSTRFYAGWYSAGAGSDTPDRLEVALDKEAYAPGETAQLKVVARDAGQLLVTVVSDRLIHMETLAVAEGEATVPVPVTAEWGAGAYVAASLIRPMDAASGRNPSRALGLGWVAVDPGAAQLQARFVSEAEATPRRMMEAVLQVDGATEGETVYATIAGVDVGILNITGFEAPDPSDHYFGQRKLGMEIRDLYGRLIDGTQGNPTALRSGGDGGSSGGEAPPPTEELLALFSGVLTADDAGRVTARFNLPEFNGTMKLMAVVWSESGVGNAEQDVLVRDPVVVSAALPRFLAPGDSSRLLLELAHTSGPAGRIGVTIGGGDEISIPASATNQTIELAEGGRTSMSIPITAGQAGDSFLQVNVVTPSGQVLTKRLNLGIRANDPEIARQTRVKLAAGSGEMLVDSNVFAGIAPGTGRVTVAAGPLARFDAPGLLMALDRYPYGCAEQITSRAMPLLYFSSVSERLGLVQEADVAERIQDAITGVLANQGRNGGFGLWYADSGDLWLESYVTDFLSRARAKGYEVPERAFISALDNLRNRVNYAPDFESGGEGIAYALHVLAREGYASIGDLRYYADARAQNFSTPLAKAQLGAALASYGDQGRADMMFGLAAGQLRANSEDRTTWRVDYGSDERDRAAVLTLAVESGSEAVNRLGMANDLANSLTGNAYRSTQENLWALMATNALIDDGASSGLTRDGVPVEGAFVEAYDRDTLRGNAFVIGNAGAMETEVVVTTFGVPNEPEPAQGNGYRILRRYYTMDGEEVSLETVPQNTRLVATVSVYPERRADARLMVDDPLPAGFEIDNPNLIQGGDIAALDWLDVNGWAEFTEFRTDRFRAAINWSGTAPFTMAYIVRAVSPGEFYHPAASVEDMYRPAFRARSGTGEVRVTPAQ